MLLVFACFTFGLLAPEFYFFTVSYFWVIGSIILLLYVLTVAPMAPT